MTATPEVYFFDMDHTLIDNDCDVSWKDFMVAEKLAPPEALKTADYFYQTYLEGRLDPDAFTRFQLNEFIGRTEPEMSALCRKHFETIVKPKIYPEAEKLVRNTIGAGHRTVLLTATNRIIAKPLADYFGIPTIVATELETDAKGCYTGRFSGTYAAAEGKLAKAEEFCRDNGLSLKTAACYGDSINDRFLLAAAGFPFAVNPGPELKKLAVEKGWKILNFGTQK
jgi:HAD superfamily hydrolase (TIGR01490 family)